MAMCDGAMAAADTLVMVMVRRIGIGRERLGGMEDGGWRMEDGGWRVGVYEYVEETLLQTVDDQAKYISK